MLLKDETCEKAKALLKKLYLQSRLSGTEAVLIAHKLNNQEYLRVVGKPAHLIVSLYEHPSISERLCNPSDKAYPGEEETPASGPKRLLSCLPVVFSQKLEFLFCTFLSSLS